MVRTSTRTGALLAAGSSCRSWIARKTWDCVGRGRLTISSRNRLPPSASWNAPSCRSQPNSSASIPVSDFELQSMATNGCSAAAA